jgi:hypothetical protein
MNDENIPMNKLVQIIKDDDGFPKDDADVWHLVDPCNDQGPAALCTQEFFGIGESVCEFKTKMVNAGGITCPECLRKIRDYKAVRL